MTSDHKCVPIRNLWICTTTVLLCCTGIASAQQAATLAPGVVAAQGGAQVTLQDIDAFAAQMPQADRAGFFDSPKRIEGVIMNLLLKRQLAAEARAAGLDQTAGVQRQIQLSTENTLARVDIDNFRNNLKLPNFEELAHEYYLSHKEEFVKPGKVVVKHVLVSTDSRDDDQAKARIGVVEAAARMHPDQFDALVEKYSDDPSMKINHGLIEDADSRKLAGPFAKAARSLKTVGEISPIVKTKFGYHVLKLISHTPDVQRSFATVREGLIAKLSKDWIDKQVDEHTGQMRGNKMNANPELVASLRTRYVSAGTELPEKAAKKSTTTDAAEAITH